MNVQPTTNDAISPADAAMKEKAAAVSEVASDEVRQDSPLALEIAAAVHDTLVARRRWPEATYRLQFHFEHLKFADGETLVPYLNELGISHLYASPCLRSASNSPHGYDVVDYSQLNPQLGGKEAFDAMVNSLHQHGMGLLQDIVPNHMSIVAAENNWWNDVLENGQSSPFARCFDIDWHPITPFLDNKVLLPLLGGQYGEVLEAGDLKLEYHDGGFFVRYWSRRLPLDPRTYPAILSHRQAELLAALGEESEAAREFASIGTALEYLPATTETTPERIAERQREKEVIKSRLRRLTADSPAVLKFIEQNLSELNGTPDDPHSFDRLDALLNAQVFRLARWKAAADEVNYRRFFDINELIALCTEQPHVFDLIHQRTLSLLVSGHIDGLRIDHIDGLYDPLEYLWRLQWGYVKALARVEFERRQPAPPPKPAGVSAPAPAATDVPSPTAPAAAELPPTWEQIEPQVMRKLRAELGTLPPAPLLPLYAVVEKILGPDEPLPAEWPVAGTTGYDFLNLLNRLLVDHAGLHELRKTYQRFTGDRDTFREVAYESRRLIFRVAMTSELLLLAHRINRISERHRRTRDFTLNSLRTALREILTCFPVYRTYIHEGRMSDRDRQMVQRAVAQAKRRNPARDAAVFDFIREVLLMQQPPDLDEAGRNERELFVGRFQQVTSPLVAKGIEDTAFYLNFPLVSLNEVGGDPERGAGTMADFHHDNSDRLLARRGSLVATTTHDTKRSEDVRARINVLSEVPQRWRASLNHWTRFNRRHYREVDGQPAPSRNDECLLYQTLFGVWPLESLSDGPVPDAFIERIQNYMEKAIHEAKRRTSWISPNADYDAAVRDFVAAILTDSPRNKFLGSFRTFVDDLVDWGLYSALSQTLLKLASPGVPDIYQGQELWEFLLVDPDNRRPVDFERRRILLAELKAAVADGGDGRLVLARELAAHPRDPRLKLLVTWDTLQFRRRNAALFQYGQYEPLVPVGQASEHVCAFAWRRTLTGESREEVAVVIAPRFFARLALAAAPTSEGNSSATAPLPLGDAVWGDTRLNVSLLGPQRFTNLFTGQPCPMDGEHMHLADALRDFPVAVLVGEA